MVKTFPEYVSAGAPPATRLAYVVQEIVEADAIGFGENVAMNRGLQVKIFRHVEEALEWLHSE